MHTCQIYIYSTNVTFFVLDVRACSSYVRYLHKLLHYFFLCNTFLFVYVVQIYSLNSSLLFLTINIFTIFWLLNGLQQVLVIKEKVIAVVTGTQVRLKVSLSFGTSEVQIESFKLSVLCSCRPSLMMVVCKQNCPLHS